MFTHSHLPNIGLTEGKIPAQIYQTLNKEIVDIHTNDRDIVRMNNSLAGQITKEYEITKSRQLLDPFLEEMGRAYQKEWNYYPKENPNNNLIVESVWVNMQKKLEVNPLHNHDGTLSFVAWLYVPFKLEDERNMENCKNSRTVELSSTFQFVYTTALGTIANCPLFVESGWEAKVVMFPAKLLHIVYPFQTSDDYRISIAGNLH
mgnify:CR=1 FL=1|tara:strand:- start:77 stop:688 length:612 start_codon:yes stop_codon:yes gene_type:complete